MKRTLDFGKIDFTDSGEPTNPVTVELELSTDPNPRFSVSAGVWNFRKTDMLMGGQCLDSLVPFFWSNRLFMTIYRLWILYHLNDMHCGTPTQELFLSKLPPDFQIPALGITKNGTSKDWFDRNSTILELVGLKTVPASEADPYRDPDSKRLGQPFTYGYEWLYHPIPPSDLALIKRILDPSVSVADLIHSLQ